MKRIAALIAAFFRPRIIAPLPKGMVADNTGALGLLGFMQNANNQSDTLSSVATTSTSTTIVPASLVAGVIQLNTGAAGQFAATLPSTGSIIAAFGPTVPLDGSFTKPITIINNSAQPATLTAGDGGTTIVGTNVIGSSFVRSYLMQILGSSTLSLTNMGFSPL